MGYYAVPIALFIQCTNYYVNESIRSFVTLNRRTGQMIIRMIMIIIIVIIILQLIVVIFILSFPLIWSSSGTVQWNRSGMKQDVFNIVSGSLFLFKAETEFVNNFWLFFVGDRENWSSSFFRLILFLKPLVTPKRSRMTILRVLVNSFASISMRRAISLVPTILFPLICSR